MCDSRVPVFQIQGGAALTIMTADTELSPGQHMANKRPVRTCMPRAVGSERWGLLTGGLEPLVGLWLIFTGSHLNTCQWL